MAKKRSKKRKKKILKLILFFIICIVLILVIVNLFKKNKVTKNYSESSVVETKNVIKDSVFPDEVYGVPVYTLLVEEGTEARTGTKRIIKYIVIHETDNFAYGVGAENHAQYLKNNNETSIAWHYTVDDHEIYHHIPDNEIAYHAGEHEGNLYGIGIELCVNKDGNFENTFVNAAKLVAYLIEAYDLTIDDVKTHQDFNGKDCPHSILANNRLAEFKNLVKSYLN